MNGRWGGGGGGGGGNIIYMSLKETDQRNVSFRLLSCNITWSVDVT